jgi:hypothetical protein
VAAQAGRRLDRLTRNAAPLATDLRAARAGGAAWGHDLARRRSARCGHRSGNAVGRPYRGCHARAAVGIARDARARSAAPCRHGGRRRETRGRDLLRRAATAADAGPELLRLQRQTLGILQQSLAIQRRPEQHAASLDRKTGGTAPVAGLAPAPLP